MNADGTGQARLTNTLAIDVEPAWSPYGSEIAFASNREGGDFDVFTIHTTAGNLTQVTTDPSHDRQPAWLSHTSRSVLAFVRNGDVIRDELGVAGDTNITNTALTAESHPNWAPVDGRIAWDSDATGDREIEAAEGDGSNVTPVTANAVPDVEPTWSSDGQKIAFERNGDLWTMNADGTGQNAITAGSAVDGAPDWQSIVSKAGYPRPLSGLSVVASLVPAYAECVSPNREHGPPLSFGSCSPPAQRSSHLTMGTFDANGAAAKSVGYMRIRVSPGAPGLPHDTATRLYIEVSDVRCAGGTSACGSANDAGGADYTGELAGRVVMRITDKANGLIDGVRISATMTEYTMRFPIPCAATADTSVGAKCTLFSYPDIQVPGITPEGTRAIWAFGQFDLDDGGPDGDAETLDNTRFLTQGIFIP